MSQRHFSRNPTGISKTNIRKRLLAEVWGDSLFGMRHIDLARLCGISPATLSLILYGRRSPSLAAASRLAPLLGMSVAELYMRHEKAQRIMADADDPLRGYPIPDSV